MFLVAFVILFFKSLYSTWCKQHSPFVKLFTRYVNVANRLCVLVSSGGSWGQWWPPSPYWHSYRGARSM